MLGEKFETYWARLEDRNAFLRQSGVNAWVLHWNDAQEHTMPSPSGYWSEGEERIVGYGQGLRIAVNIGSLEKLRKLAKRG